MSEKRKEKERQRQREVDYKHFNGFYVLTKCQLMVGNCDIWSVTNYSVYFESNQYE